MNFNEQRAKHCSPIRISRISFSKVTDSSLACSKHDLGRSSTFPGIQIDFNEQRAKHQSPIRMSCDSRANVIDSRVDV
jgi:hypothetical protein